MSFIDDGWESDEESLELEKKNTLDPEQFFEWGRTFFTPSDIAFVIFSTTKEVVQILNDETDPLARSYRKGVQEGIETVQNKVYYDNENPFEQVKFYDEKLGVFLKKLNIQMRS